MKRISALALVSAALAVARPAPAPPLPVTLTLVQPASVAPGTLTGWGFTVTNGTSDWLVVTGVTASPELTAVGSFTDVAAQYEFVVVPPSGFVTQSYDFASQTGAGSFLCGSAHASASGTLTMTYDVYSYDPTAAGFDPIGSGVSFGNSVSAAATFGTTPVGLRTFRIE